jgi:hypothetical protein
LLKNILNIVSEADFRDLCKSVGAEFMQCHDIEWGAYDIVGVNSRTREIIEEHRLVGLLFRYFPSHEARLGEFQKRIDVARSNFEARYGRRSDESPG